ncbi:MAG: methyltransferase domain-containing protein, partial [Niveispirillum sp.]|nr:methyltransferase domain-containing protein [Niveispirillum sp.]
MTKTVVIVESQRWHESANAWDHWADGMANPADRINQPLLDLADAPPRARVLDLAAGVGEPSLTQARRLGSDGLVVASDLVPAMLSGLGRRTVGHPHPPHPVAADMTALPFAGAGFDRVLCRFGLMFVPDLQAALTEMHRVLRPGGAAALAVWGRRAGNSLFDRLGRILAQEYGSVVEALLSPLFRFADPGNLLSQAREAGFPDGRVKTLTLTTPAKVAQPFWLPT